MAKNLFFLFFISTLVKILFSLKRKNLTFSLFSNSFIFFLAVNLKTVRATILLVRKLTTVGE
jgi:hypothetical protein